MNFHAFSTAPEPYGMIKAVPAEQRDDILITVTHAWAVGQCRIKALHDATQAVQIKGRARYPFEIGFKPWDLTLAGVRKTDASWTALAAKGHMYPNWESDARPWPSPPYKVNQSFENTPPGVIGIRNAKCERPREQKDLGEGFGVSEEAASPIPVEGSGPSKRSLKAQDVQGLVHSCDPVLDIHPKWESGTFHVSFDIMAQPEAAWFFEMRARRRPDRGRGQFF